ncbi:MAG TPA: hypothetical protein P5234_16375 [Thermoanaerobaculaceae bacterium]|nr:hypothetical protein [Thermoanaerobaculaceae bacterium]
MKRICILLVLAALITCLPTVSALATLGDCRICAKDGEVWTCMEAEDLGYENCSPSPNGCANWEPLCETGYNQDPNCWYIGNGWWICFF